ncbi:PxORF119 peptide [Plutella xylostella granulovirus]|uniref:ORF117 protein n=1 Tax=Plutella xylostella granulovirus TaxID=98383 RepID=Q9DVR4_9BBAC|nr:PxORF119 peptide [Plutella xylostella granulovirus]AAG27417.1 PxORF119 peptide [Plutella xylostella granulovirus]AMQ35729.1 PxGV-Corf117 protein [Plutella xylostella granulovirus]AMQ35846.1 PxGV-Korf117 protein [Plutella xylostella granulovirus]AMQ35963.1 PxGV-Morf117 protein [Plutella xylostella granulovirus]AMQ36080.1 PxGV-Torf117 protein [Plutella xylostella granulovirus]
MKTRLEINMDIKTVCLNNLKNYQGTEWMLIMMSRPDQRSPPLVMYAVVIDYYQNETPVHPIAYVWGPEMGSRYDFMYVEFLENKLGVKMVPGALYEGYEIDELQHAISFNITCDGIKCDITVIENNELVDNEDDSSDDEIEE